MESNYKLLNEKEITGELKIKIEELATDKYVEFHHRPPTEHERKSIEHEIIKNFNLTLENKYKSLNKSFDVLKNILPLKLTAPEWNQIREEFQNISKLEFGKKVPFNLQEYFKISDSSMEYIYKIGVELYETHQEDAVYVFDFLITLNPFEKHYWLGYGLSLKKLQKFESALYCFALTYLFDDKPIVARAESIDCYLEMDQKEDAQLELDELEKLINADPELERKWKNKMEEYKNLITKNK